MFSVCEAVVGSAGGGLGRRVGGGAPRDDELRKWPRFWVPGFVSRLRFGFACTPHWFLRISVEVEVAAELVLW